MSKIPNESPRQEYRGKGNKGGKGQRPPKRIQHPDRRPWEREPEPDPIAGGEPVRMPKEGKWKRHLDKWLERREEEREAEQDECGRDRRKMRMPRPYLDATSNFAPQITALRVGEAGSVSFTVWNDGNYPAWTCYVELYEGPGGYTSPLSDYELRGRTVITLHPGERREVSVPWARQRETGRIVGIVHDPLLDPRDFDLVEQFNRHITSVHYLNLE